MNFKNQYLLFAALFILFSCEKTSDEGQINYPRTFESKNVVETNLRVFTKDGRLNDQETENNFINSNLQYIQDLQNLSVEGEFSFELLSEEDVLIHKLFNFEDNTRDVISVSGVDYWENEGFSVVNPNYLYYQQFYKHQPLTTSTVPVGNNSVEPIIKHCFYTIKDNGAVKMPMVDYALFRVIPQLGLSDVVYIPTANNEFDPESISQLGETDTLILREYYIEFR